MDKVVGSAAEAVAGIASGSTLAVGGFGLCGIPAVLIDAPLEVRAARLAERNRESPAEVLARLGRVVTGFDPADADLTIDNTGTLEEAANRLVAWLRALQ